VIRRNTFGVDIIVRDNGRGFRNDQSMASHAAGFGLSGIDQRAKMLGGALTIHSAADTGTTVHVTIPLALQQL
jgi:signal transduction histidine kinase